MKSKRLKVLCLSLIFVVILSACSDKKSKSSENNNSNVSNIQEQSTSETFKYEFNQKIQSPNENGVSTSSSTVSSMNTTPNGIVEDIKQEDSSKLDNEIRHNMLLESLSINRDIVIPLMAFSPDYSNIFTGETIHGINKEYFKEFFNNDKVYKVDSISKLVDNKKKEVLNYDEIMKSPEKYFVKNKAGFKYQQGDILVIFPPAKDSPLKNGWVGVYRKEQVEWKIVAGSF